MNFQFSIPSLPETTQCIPNQLIQLASNLPDVTISIPNVDKVLEAIDQGKADQISKLDWVYCIHAKAQWDQQNIGFTAFMLKHSGISKILGLLHSC